MSINKPVLVLNQNYQPLNVCNARRAIVLLGRGKAETLIDCDEHIATMTRRVPIPSVIRLIYMVKRPLVRRRLSRRAVFYRDGVSLPILRLGVEEPHAGSHHTSFPKGTACVGECGERVHSLQPSQGRVHTARS